MAASNATVLKLIFSCGSSTWPISPSTSSLEPIDRVQVSAPGRHHHLGACGVDPSRRGLVLGVRVGEDFLRLLELPDIRVSERRLANLEQQLGPIAETLRGSIGLFAHSEARCIVETDQDVREVVLTTGNGAAKIVLLGQGDSAFDDDPGLGQPPQLPQEGSFGDQGIDRLWHQPEVLRCGERPGPRPRSPRASGSTSGFWHTPPPPWRAPDRRRGRHRPRA